jgi:hypothetical protein
VRRGVTNHPLQVVDVSRQWEPATSSRHSMIALRRWNNHREIGEK